MRVVIKDKKGNYIKSTVVNYQSNLMVGIKPGCNEDDGYYTVLCDGEDIQDELGCWTEKSKASEILEWILERLDSGQVEIRITKQ